MLKNCKENDSDHDIEPLSTLACISKNNDILLYNHYQSKKYSHV